MEHKRVDVESMTFVAYFHTIRMVLEGKAQLADQKASILLDKGVAYSRAGVLFFLLSILAWQYMAMEGGFQAHHIFGMVSCSLLFVFIEFLSAWFLKQYRHFVDTSTYLIKVKSIFDRFMLSYLEQWSLKARKEARPSTEILEQLWICFATRSNGLTRICSNPLISVLRASPWTQSHAWPMHCIVARRRRAESFETGAGVRLALPVVVCNDQQG